MAGGNVQKEYGLCSRERLEHVTRHGTHSQAHLFYFRSYITVFIVSYLVRANKVA